MKIKVASFITILSLTLALIVGVSLHRQSVQASPAHATVSIIGGFILAQRTSHITISTIPETPVGMRIFYRCTTGLVRIVYPNTHTNVLGRYTWQWTTGAPCHAGYAVVIVNARLGRGMIDTQKRFTIVPLPAPKPIPTASPTPAPSTGVNGNPWGYDFNPGNPIYTPPSTFCTYFDCIASFWNGTGYIIECGDTTYSLSGGNRGACSRHGGEFQELYSH